VIQAQWEAVMGTRPWAGRSGVQEHPNHPAVYVSWKDVQAFIGRLNAFEGAAVYRLPTEAEWEYACGAGTRTSWSFGEDVGQLGAHAWYAANARDAGQGYAHRVGGNRKKEDMHQLPANKVLSKQFCPFCDPVSTRQSQPSTRAHQWHAALLLPSEHIILLK
jgi:formylglycine-generating enzyme required for sulfatase activity